VSSPLVRRIRLGAAIRDLRHAADLTSEQLAKAAGMNRLDVSRMETAARKPDINKVMACLEALGIKENTKAWRTLVRVSRDANRRGWWDEPEWITVGDRQKRYADVESGGEWIGLYHNCLIPGILQTEAYIAARGEALSVEGLTVNIKEGEFRLRRQADKIREGGPRIEVLLEEQVVRRLIVDRTTMAEQLRYLLTLTERHTQITIRVIPVECSFALGHVPRSPLALHTFNDPEDGTALLLETVNDDLLMCDASVVNPYVRLYERTRDAAMSEADTVAFIRKHAAKLAAGR
jgi:transcriptional regulator with XRE-family HTH domain